MYALLVRVLRRPHTEIFTKLKAGQKLIIRSRAEHHHSNCKEDNSQNELNKSKYQCPSLIVRSQNKRSHNTNDSNNENH